MSIIAQNETPLQPAPPPKVKVKVVVKDGAARITSTHTVGHPSAIAQHLPSRRMRDRVETLVNSYGYTLNNCIINSAALITNFQWSEAIAAEIICRLAASQESETEMSSVAEGGYLAIGNAVYRMSPVEIGPASKAMRAIHHRTIEKAHTESARIVKVANDQCAAILNDAAAKRAEAELALATATDQLRQLPPRWAVDSSIPLKMSHGHWCVGFNAPITLQSYVYRFETPRALTNGPRSITTKTWKALPQTIPVLTQLWVPLSDAKGSYKHRSIFVDPHHNRLPHVKWEGACMDLAAAPGHINSSESLGRLAQCFTTAHTIVEVHSLYTHFINWHPILQATAPLSIKQPMIDGRYSSLFNPEYVADSTTVEPTDAEVNETWHIEPNPND